MKQLRLKEEVERRRSNWLTKNRTRYFMFEYFGEFGDRKGLIVKVDSKDGSYKIIRGLDNE